MSDRDGAPGPSTSTRDTELSGRLRDLGRRLRERRNDRDEKAPDKATPRSPGVAVALRVASDLVGGVIVVVTVPLLDKLKIDDVVGAIPVHLIAGIWGTLAVPLTNPDASFGTQIIGIVAVGAFTFVASAIVWVILKAVVGIRVSEEEEATGLDMAEIGVEAYPEFGVGSQRM